ncbi:MAG: hypothetical protein IPN27_07425 [Cellvibrionales bacterium]|nr:hypothetical protein [Cellvibrionales bacterium]
MEPIRITYRIGLNAKPRRCLILISMANRLELISKPIANPPSWTGWHSSSAHIAR